LQQFSRLIGSSIQQLQLYEYRPLQAVAFHERGGFMSVASPATPDILTPHDFLVYLTVDSFQSCSPMLFDASVLADIVQ